MEIRKTSIIYNRESIDVSASLTEEISMSERKYYILYTWNTACIHPVYFTLNELSDARAQVPFVHEE